MILYCAADLIWATKIKGTADGLGIPCRPVRNLEMLEARLVDSPVRAVVVDLEADAALEIIQRAKAASESGRTITVIAFGPHVAVDMFQQAKRLGADAVLARGAFNARMAGVLSSLSGGEPVRDVLHE